VFYIFLTFKCELCTFHLVDARRSPSLLMWVDLKFMISFWLLSEVGEGSMSVGATSKGEDALLFVSSGRKSVFPALPESILLNIDPSFFRVFDTV